MQKKLVSLFTVRTSDIDSQSLELIKEIHDRIEQLKQRGISIRTIRSELLRFQTPSHLLITGDNRLILSDYGNLEIQLPPVSKALYILFLRHSEGIVLKQISDYEDELMDIYQSIAPTHNPKRMRRSVANICNPLHNSLNEKIAQIRHTIAMIIDENLLLLYIIKGKKGESYSIALPRVFINF